MFITPQDFDGREYQVPNAVKSNDFLTFIEQKEEELLRMIMGNQMYDEFIEAYNEVYPDYLDQLDQKWKNIIDGASFTVNDVRYKYVGLKSIIKPYIFALWTRRPLFGQPTPNGVTLPKTQNSEQNVNVAPLISTAYNTAMQIIGGHGCYK